MASHTVLEAADLTLMSLSSAIATLDAHTVLTRNSQSELTKSIEELSEFLRVLSDHREPFDISSSVRKLNDCQRRVGDVSSRLIAVTDRLGTLQREIARETHQHKILIKQQLPDKPEQ
ncbi:hypothetical protein PFISCL1PPCAC_15895 [Pristionchus fissidentatus]|uniref:Biogenesis of lysosome-related organelles complex 1 subunit 7 n=1 Tax=Pristionchus fissidentatus TaxID=1538716 RepID=A0AAV5W2A0_9BILA|nr:hypothetical protein PFISCL1PPCAC_15895 [Pristionchus fissidentatus]